MKSLDFLTIIERLKDFHFPEVDLVVGIETGGMIPATLIAYQIQKRVSFLGINYRDENNRPCHHEPVLLKDCDSLEGAKRILVVDDVSVSGGTLKLAKELLKSYDVKTCVLKGQADYVLFPEIQDCVDWPWKKLKAV